MKWMLGNARARRALDLGALAVAATAAALAWYFSSPLLGGHDDGIYLATAQSVAERGEYRLVNLPTTPPQTKYPPLYPLLLAVPLKILGEPASTHLHGLKGINALALFASIVLAHALLLRTPSVRRSGHFAALLMLAASPALVSSVDFFGSELSFSALLLGLLVTCASEWRSPVRHALFLGALCGLSVLCRRVGVALAIGLVWHLWSTRGVKHSLLAACGILAVAGPWLVITALAPTPGLLLSYYVRYEPSAWSHLLSDPSLTRSILWTNAVLYVSALPAVIGWPTWWLAVGGSILAALGAHALRGTEWFALASKSCAVYLLVVASHPYPMDRYLIPLLPVVLICIGVGWGWLVRFPVHPLRLATGCALLGAILATDLIWLRRYRDVTRSAPHAGLGRALALPATKTAETIAWIRENTAPDTILAAVNDTSYYIWTDRQAIRPWPQEAESYVPGYGRYLNSKATSNAVQADLDRLCATILIEQPLLVGGESEYARRLIAGLVTSPGSPWRQAFRTSDGHTTIYRHVSDLRCGGRSR